MEINHELREGPGGEPEVWTNLGDILNWLQDLPRHSRTPIAAGVAMEIRQLLLDSFTNAEVRQTAERQSREH